MEESVVQHEQRIIYVEPNDVFDKDNGRKNVGEMLTPKYEDFCISFNLIIDHFTRFKSSGSSTQEGQNGKKTSSICWTVNPREQLDKRNSILQGNKGSYKIKSDGTVEYPNEDKYNFLTTYYTDLTYDSYKEPTQLEALGVKSVQISYENWMSPTVVINFVDVRGSALFGAEDEKHVNGKLTSENIFGSFFTIPYPLFRLQVKGFLGKPVTYQLTCSNFKGNFNSQTGNFEATATFIGYSWSLLTDIPFSFLVAAPYANKWGRDYWDRHKNTKEWGLWSNENGTVEPPKLGELFNNIRKADERIQINTAITTNTDTEESQTLGNEQECLNNIKIYLIKFINDLKKHLSCIDLGFDEENNTRQLIFFSDSLISNDIGEVIISYNEFHNYLSTYSTNYNGENLNGLSEDNLPNKMEVFTPQITFFEIFVINNDKSIKLKDYDQITVNNLKQIKLNNCDIKLTNKTASKLISEIERKNSSIKKNAYLLNVSNLFEKIEDRLTEIKNQQEIIAKRINESINYNIESLVGFQPWIGNVFKVIFCHLETFCHIIFDSSNEIYEQLKNHERKASVLGVDVNQTDLLPQKKKNNNITQDKDSIYPWPAVFNEQSSSEGKSEEKTFAWVGDFSNNFIEQQVVYSIQEGIQRLVNESKKENNSNDIVSFPLFGTDFWYKNSPFSQVGEKSTSELAGYLAMRAANIIGLMFNNNIDDNLANLFGRLDGYNLFYAVKSTGSLSNLFNNITYEDIKNITYCKEEGDKWANNSIEGTNKKYHTFETVKKIIDNYNNQGRHPMFKNNGDNNLFVHWYDKNKASLLPSFLSSYSDYKSLEYNSNDKQNPYFIPKTDSSNNAYDYVYMCDTSKLSFDKKSNKDFLESYTNSYMFKIFDKESDVTDIENRYAKLKENNGKLKIFDYEVVDDLTDYLNNVYKIDTSYWCKFFEDVYYMLSGKKTDLNIDDGWLLPNRKVYGDIEDFDKYAQGLWDKAFNKNLLNRVQVDQETGQLKLQVTSKDEKIDVTLEDVCVQQLKIKQYGTEESLFGCPFYYLQNEKFDNEEEEDAIDRITRVKALLFLHTLKYNYICTDLNVFKKDKKNGCVESVPKGYLTFIGGLLWRKRYYKNHNNIDPINYGKQNKYKKPGIDKTLLARKGNGLFFQTARNNDKNIDYYLVDGVIGIDTDSKEIDYNIENQLINLFEDFVKKFNVYITKYELKPTDIKNPIFTHDSFVNCLKNIKDYFNSSKKKTKELKKSNYRAKLKDYFSNWVGNYSAIIPLEIGNEIYLKTLFNENDKMFQDALKDLYFGRYIIFDVCGRVMGKDTDDMLKTDQINVKESSYDNYLQGFCDVVNNIIKSDRVVTISDDFQTNANIVKNKDLSIGIYYYIKQVWDKWLCCIDENFFNVENFFDKNFIFIDSFYRNTFHDVAVNCEKLLKVFDGSDKEGNVFNFLSHIVKDCDSWLFAVPDFIGFNGESTKEDVELMENLFRPMSYNEIPSPSLSNKFIVMLCHTPSSTTSEDNGFRTDNYDIWSNGAITEDGKRLFSITNAEDFNTNKDIMTRQGYNVPTFGVSFGRQNNHIFKNLTANMDNPISTEQSIAALWSVAELGADNARKVKFIGQDVFNIFSNYSYSVSFDMIGNAQICPLMYFQLLNVPMWRGTYMVYKVEHSMTPGNMNTRVTGIKMSRYAKPFNKTFFTYNNSQDNLFGGTDFTIDCDGEDYQGDSNFKKSKYFTYEELIRSTTAKNKNIDNTPDEESKKNLSKLAFNVLDKIREKYGKPIRISSGFRSKALNNKLKEQGSKVSDTSNHLWGAAADIQPSNAATTNDVVELYNFIEKMLDNGEIKLCELLRESNDKSTWVHVAIPNSHDNKTECYKNPNMKG